MIMIFVTGDTHGHIDYEKLLKLKELNLSYDDYLLICGDAGIVRSEDTLEYYVDLYNDIGCTIIFVDGNHENFDLLNTFTLVEYRGAFMHQIDQHIFHVLRGEIMVIDNLSFLCVGGAVSIDKMYRTPHLSYWKDEEITFHDVDNALYNLEKFNNKVDYVLTHCVDTHTVNKVFGLKRDVCTDQLIFIDKVVEYKHWYFGHYHHDYKINEKKTCLYQNIVRIK